MNLNLFSDCAFENNILYFYSALYGFVGKWDIFGDNRMKYHDLLDEPHNFIRTVANHEKLYSLESSGKALYFFDVRSNKHDFLSITYNTYEYGNFMDLLLYGNEILIFPRYQSEIMILDTVSGKNRIMQYDAEILNTWHCGCRHKNFYYMFPEKGGYTLGIDLCNYHVHKIEIDEVRDGFIHSVSYGEAIFLLTGKGKIYSLDTINMVMSELYDFELSDPAGQIVVTNHRIIVLPRYQRHDIYVWDRDIRKSYVYSEYPRDFCYQAAEVWNAYEGMTDIGDYYLYAMRSTNYALMINKISGEIQWKRPRNIDGQFMCIMAGRGESQFYESEENYRLIDYIGYVTDSD